MVNETELINGVNFLAKKLDIDQNSVKDLANDLGNKVENLFLVIGTESNGKAFLTCYISKNLVAEKQLNAGQIIVTVGSIVNATLTSLKTGTFEVSNKIGLNNVWYQPNDIDPNCTDELITPMTPSYIMEGGVQEFYFSNSVSAAVTPGLFISTTAVQASCSNFCNNKLTIPTLSTTLSSNTFINLAVGDVISGATLVAGWYAYANVSTDTETGEPFRIFRLDGVTNQVQEMSDCNLNTTCNPL